MTKLNEVILRDTLANRPAAGVAGRLFYDTTNNQLQRDNGSVWESVEGSGGGGGAPVSATYVVEDADGTLTAERVLGTTVITQAAYGSRQAAAKAGRLFFPTDGFTLDRDNGSAWTPYGPIFPLTPPVDGDFAWVNQGSATVTTANGGIHLSDPANVGGGFRIRKKAAPATPYSIVVCMLPLIATMAVGGNNPEVGMCWRQSTDGKLVVVRFANDVEVINLFVDKFTNPTTFSARYTSMKANHFLAAGALWLKLEDDGTNRKVHYGVDGVNWQQLHSVSRTDFLTADEVGFYASAGNATYKAGVTLLSWKQG